jgi:hypothetical protein
MTVPPLPPLHLPKNNYWLNFDSISQVGLPIGFPTWENPGIFLSFLLYLLCKREVGFRVGLGGLSVVGVSEKVSGLNVKEIFK